MIDQSIGRDANSSNVVINAERCVNEAATEHIKVQDSCCKGSFTDIQQVTNVTLESLTKESDRNNIDKVEVTRILENKEMPNKDLQALNSTENLFSDYDPAMVYRANASKPVVGEDTNYLGYSRKTESADKPIQYTGKIETQLEQVKETAQINKMQTLNKCLKPKKKSALKLVRHNSLEWNFAYISPYAMSEKEKEQILERKVRLERKRKHTERRKAIENERRRQENEAAFNAWKTRKRSEKQRTTLSTESLSAKIYRTKSMSWYP